MGTVRSLGGDTSNSHTNVISEWNDRDETEHKHHHWMTDTSVMQGRRDKVPVNKREDDNWDEVKEENVHTINSVLDVLSSNGTERTEQDFTRNSRGGRRREEDEVGYDNIGVDGSVENMGEEVVEFCHWDGEDAEPTQTRDDQMHWCQDESIKQMVDAR